MHEGSRSLVLLAVIVITGLLAPEAHSAVYVSGTYNIVTALNSNKVLDVYGAGQDNRTNIQIYDYNDNKLGYYLDVDNAGTRN